MYRLPMTVVRAVILIVGLLLPGALRGDEGQGFRFVVFHPASWNVKTCQVRDVADSLGMWISR